jgi:hypothetical protein
MFKLESVAAFAALAGAGSISAAALRLALPKSVVSERLADAGLGIALRTSGKIRALMAWLRQFFGDPPYWD